MLRSRGARIAWGTGAVLLIAGAVVATVLASDSTDSSPRGATDPKTTASLFVRAIDAGDGTAAVQLSCPSFADGARSLARTGKDAGISFRQVSLSAEAPAPAGAKGERVLRVEQTIEVGGAQQRSAFGITLRNDAGRWQACGRVASG